MASQVMRQNVLAVFKKLHRTRQKIFNQDSRALGAAREKINEEFRKNKTVADDSSISELLQYAKDVELELRTTVIQAKEVTPGKFEARINEDTVKMDNVEFDIAKCPDPKPRKRRSPCESEGKQ